MSEIQIALPLGVTGNTPDSSGALRVHSLDTTSETTCVNALEVGEPLTGNAEPSPARGRCRDWGAADCSRNGEGEGTVQTTNARRTGGGESRSGMGSGESWFEPRRGNSERGGTIVPSRFMFWGPMRPCVVRGAWFSPLLGSPRPRQGHSTVGNHALRTTHRF